MRLTERAVYVVRFRPASSDVDGVQSPANTSQVGAGFGLRCVGVEEVMLNRDAEFRRALAQVRYAVGEITKSRSIKDVLVGDLNDTQINWLVTRAIFAWNDVQRKSIGLRLEQFENFLAKLGELSLPWDKLLRDWSKTEMVDLLSGALTLVLKADPNLPPFLTAPKPTNDIPLEDNDVILRIDRRERRQRQAEDVRGSCGQRDQAAGFGSRGRARNGAQSANQDAEG
jgi:hypothetical protein